MWKSRVLGTDSPWALVRAVYVTTGLPCTAPYGGGQEHRDLSIDQFKRFPDDCSYDGNTYYEYTEHGSKNYQGKFADMDNKICRVYAKPSSPQCPVCILDLYFSKLLIGAKAYYMRLSKRCQLTSFPLVYKIPYWSESSPKYDARYQPSCKAFYSVYKPYPSGYLSN